MKYKLIPLLILFFLVHLNVHAQIFKNYTTVDGLASNEVYDVFQDSRGFMWFATSSGVSRFDGSKFKSYNVGDGLPGNTIFGFYEDSFHRIWFRTFNGKLGFFDLRNSKLTRIETILNSSSSHIIAIQEKDGKIIFTYLRGNQIELDNCKDILSNDITLKHIPEVAGLNLNYFIKKNQRFDIESQIGSAIYFGSSLQFRCNKEYQILLSQGRLFSSCDRFNSFKEHMIPNKAFRGISGFIDKNHPIYLFYDDSIASYDLVSENYQLLWGIPSPSNVLVDKNEGVWISSLTDGVFYCISTEIKEHYPFKGKSVSQLSLRNSELYFSANRSNLIRMNNQESYETYSLLGEIQNIQFGNDVLVTATNSYIFKNGNLSMEVTGRWYLQSNKNYIQIFSDGSFSTSKDFTNNLERKTFKNMNRDAPHQNYRSIFQVGDTLILTKLLGYDLFDLKHQRFITEQKNVLLNNYRISDIDFIRSHQITSTRGGGLIIIEKDKEKQYLEKDGLLSNVIFDCEIDSNYIWLATPKGINKIPYIQSEEKLILKLEESVIFTRSNFLSTNHVQDLAITDDLIYFGSHLGLFSFNKEYQPKTIKPIIHIDYVKSENDKYRDFKKLSFGPNRNIIQVELVGVHYPSESNLRYAYRLNQENEWTMTSSKSLQFVDLDPGEYKLFVKSITLDGLTESDVKSLKFAVQPAFYETFWFKFSLVLLLIFVLGIIILFRFRQLRKKIKLKLELYKLENKATRAQLNPHFVFNALNSIQNYISKNSSENAEKYLSKFSKLIRWVLDDGGKELIPIEKEIEFLHFYIPLEQMRLKDKFTYSINVDSEIDSEVEFIPPFIIQPFVENAIWHGLQPLEEMGFLNIEVNKIQQGIEIIISDNGVGIKNNTRSNLKSSLGVKLTKRRLELLENLYKRRVSIDTVTSSSEISHGTTVKIKIITHD